MRSSNCVLFRLRNERRVERFVELREPVEHVGDERVEFLDQAAGIGRLGGDAQERLRIDARNLLAP